MVNLNKEAYSKYYGLDQFFAENQTYYSSATNVNSWESNSGYNSYTESSFYKGGWFLVGMTDATETSLLSTLNSSSGLVNVSAKNIDVYSSQFSLNATQFTTDEIGNPCIVFEKSGVQLNHGTYRTISGVDVTTAGCKTTYNLYTRDGRIVVPSNFVPLNDTGITHLMYVRGTNIISSDTTPTRKLVAVDASKWCLIKINDTTFLNNYRPLPGDHILIGYDSDKQSKVSFDPTGTVYSPY